MTKWLTVLSRFFTFSTRFVGVLLVIILIAATIYLVTHIVGCARPVTYYRVEKVIEHFTEEEMQDMEQELEQCELE